ncbi:MAG TPA: BrnA antitoxin family protein [Candidatus Saccharimonadales bacterium]|nr:BrnA antitoxin family protein [Candidatus Saccharimonadales bacterium]
MSNVRYTDAPDDINEALDHAVVIEDFLPSPEEFIRRAKKEKITIAIDKYRLDLYKAYAKKHDAKYQTMINDILGSYADKYLVKK